MIGLDVAFAYAIGGWATLAIFAYVAAVDPKTYLLSDFWCFFIMSLIWPISWPLGICVLLSLKCVSIIRAIRRKLK